MYSPICISSVQSLSCVRLFATPRTAARQASLSNTSSRSLLKLMSIESVVPSNHLILCRPFLLLPSIFSSLRVFSNESALHIRWPKYWSFSFSISLSSEHSGLIFLGLTGLIFLQSKGLSRVFSNTTVPKHQFFSTWSTRTSVPDSSELFYNWKFVPLNILHLFLSFPHTPRTTCLFCVSEIVSH